MKSLFLTALLGFSALSLTSCASKEEDPTKADREKISTVPWSKPERWEGKGALGGMVQ
jgi:hypothetical protein